VEQKVSFADFVRNHIISVMAAAIAVFIVILLLLLQSRKSEKRAKISETETREALKKIEVLNKELADNKVSLQEALAASQQASLAKTTFLNNMSHEIRTPLNSIIGFTALAEQHIDDRERVLGYIQNISTSGKHLLSLINDVLDVSRIESGRMVLRDEEFDFNGFLVQINTIIGGQCTNKGLTYSAQIIGTLCRAYFGDEMKLKEVLINILGNAVKYTPAGGTVCFSVEQTAAFNGLCTLRFVVKDTGIGMSEEFLPKLFDPFSQESDDSPNQYGSTGLGMAITRSIVQMMNGEVSVESRKGVGSTFTITVTLKDANKGTLMVDANQSDPGSGGVEDKSTDGQPISLAGLRVLIAEDIEMNAELLGDILDLEDIEHEWAENGQVALEKFSESAENYYDAILMDIRMPVMDGLQATREIRALNRPDAETIPIIAMSANAFSEDVQKSLQAGMNAHLSKPVDPDQLFEALGKIAAKRLD
jgi:signal transduction histidine kinase/CheY-like chemotaxis protein